MLNFNYNYNFNFTFFLLFIILFYFFFLENQIFSKNCLKTRLFERITIYKTKTGIYIYIHQFLDLKNI